MSLYILLYGKAPFIGKDFEEIKEKVITTEVDYSGIEIDVNLREILKGLLEKDHTRRFNA